MSRLGTGGNIGTEAAARVRPDGYTILMRSLSPNAVNVHLYSRLGFDPIKDFESIVYVSAVPNILVVAADSPIKTAKDLINAAKTAPGKLTYGTAGVSSSQHLAASLLGIVTGTTMTHVPYKGAGIAQQDLLAGHINFMLDTTGPISFVQSGRMRALAVAAKTRSPALPDVPTFDEVGVANIHSSAWYGLMAPAGTPIEIINRLNAEANVVLRDPETKKRLATLGADFGGGTPDEFSKFVAAEVISYSVVVKASGAKLD